MILGFRHHWRLTWPDIWKRLADSANAPDDLFMALYRSANDYLVTPVAEPAIDTIVNEPKAAEAAFRSLKADSFASEARVKAMLEALYTTIAEFDRANLTARYAELVQQFIDDRNLRYRITPPFKVQPLVTGTFAQLYYELERATLLDVHLKQLLGEFERAFAAYVDTSEEGDLKRCIASASILAEGIAGKTLSQNGKTLGFYCDQMTCWPHAAVKDALKKMYGFCSDYPGIRHAGNPAGSLRSLEAKDALVICSLITFLGYLSQDIDIRQSVI